MTRFIAALCDELEKIATTSREQPSDLAETQKLEDGVKDVTLGYKPKIGSGGLGQSVGGPLLADPSRYPYNRLAP